MLLPERMLNIVMNYYFIDYINFTIFAKIIQDISDFITIIHWCSYLHNLVNTQYVGNYDDVCDEYVM